MYVRNAHALRVCCLQIERRQELHYSKTSAVLLPIVGPTLMALYAGW